ncbi:histone H1 [bacterium]|nr:histone H1 [bacterium]
MILENLKTLLEVLSSEENLTDAAKTEQGNAAAGRRLRKACLQAIKDLKELRTEALESTRK